MLTIVQAEMLYTALAYRFEDPMLVSLALTHCSYNGVYGQNNQRLEFLGDAILDFVISERLYCDANVDEGHLTRMRASVVCEGSLARAAHAIGIGPLILLGKGEEATGGRDKPSILADVMEAILGAVYLDGGFDAVRECVMHVLKDAVQSALDDGGGQDHKTMLQQICAKNQLDPPIYDTIAIEGPPHAPLFTVGVLIGDRLLCNATGRTKKEAEQRAAEHATIMLQNKKDTKA